jgi:hypothetical protein
MPPPPGTSQSNAEQFDSVVRDLCPYHAKPTPASIAQVNAHFGVILPHELIQLAAESRSYSSWFASVGPDFMSPTHIVRINSYWRQRRRKRRIPPNLVAFTIGFDDEFWCFEKTTPSDGLAVQFWSPHEIVYSNPEPPTTAYESFQLYLSGQIFAWKGDA